MEVERKSVEEHLAYITDEQARSAAQQILEWLEHLDPSNIASKGLRHRISCETPRQQLRQYSPKTLVFPP